MIRGMIFDADGTLLDSSSVWENAADVYLEKRGIPAEEGLGKKLFAMTLEAGARYLKEAYCLQDTEEEILQGVLTVVEQFYQREAQLKAGAEDFLRQLAEKRIPAVIATSSEKGQIEAALERLGVSGYFREIFTCSQIGAGKDRPLIFQRAAECLETTPEETWVAEDGLYAMKTAAASGFRVLGVYDEGSRQDWDEIQHTADLALPDLTQFHRFWEFASAR